MPFTGRGRADDHSNHSKHSAAAVQCSGGLSIGRSPQYFFHLPEHLVRNRIRRVRSRVEEDARERSVPLDDLKEVLEIEFGVGATLWERAQQLSLSCICVRPHPALIVLSSSEAKLVQ